MGVKITLNLETIKNYYSLTKPGVLYGNAITAAAGFLFASQRDIDFLLFLALFFGTSFVIASACVLNNVLDQDIDKVMSRTKKRAIVNGSVSGKNAAIFSIVLVVLGISILYVYVNVLVVLIGVVGFIDYVVLYGMLSKRLSWHSTLVGSISGATPILAGYVAVTNRIDASAILIFMVLFLWQMPEFYSIAIYRMKEYKSAGVPIISVVKGKKFTSDLVVAYTLLFVISTLLIGFLDSTSWTYVVVMSLLGARWIWLAMRSSRLNKIDAWAKQMFHFSLIVLLTFSLLISINSWLP